MSWALLVSQLLSQETLPNRRTLKSFNENVPGGKRVGIPQPDSQHFKQSFTHWEIFPSNASESFDRNL